MCARFTLHTSNAVVARALHAADTAPLPARYNIAPTEPILAAVEEGGARRLVLARWGLVPPWMKDPKKLAPMVNARAETVAEKPAFRKAFEERRCVIPADGFFEWRKAGKARHPYLFTGDGPLWLAGLWERSWEPGARPTPPPTGWGEATPPVEPPFLSATILTTDANEVVAPLHDRMPVILPDLDAVAAWLDPRTPAAERLALCVPLVSNRLRRVAVGDRVNKVGIDAAELIHPREDVGWETPIDPT